MPIHQYLQLHLAPDHVRIQTLMQFIRRTHRFSIKRYDDVPRPDLIVVYPGDGLPGKCSPSPGKV